MSALPRHLPQAFFARDALEVARDLIGTLLVRDDVVLRLTEVEAYREGDSANHCRAGKTARNAPMWGPPGHAYLYLCYGLHHLLNLVTDRDGVGAAVLVRSAEIVAGHDTVLARRRAVPGPEALRPALLTGPGKVAQALDCVAVVSNHLLMDGEMRGQLKDAGLRALCYTVNETADAERLLALGIDGIITDAVDRFSPASPGL